MVNPLMVTLFSDQFFHSLYTSCSLYKDHVYIFPHDQRREREGKREREEERKEEREGAEEIV